MFTLVPWNVEVMQNLLTKQSAVLMWRHNDMRHHKSSDEIRFLVQKYRESSILTEVWKTNNTFYIECQIWKSNIFWNNATRAHFVLLYEVIIMEKLSLVAITLLIDLEESSWKGVCTPFWPKMNANDMNDVPTLSF